MNDTTLQTAPITLDRRLLLGDTEYQVTVFPADDDRLDLCIVSSDTDGQVVSEISGVIAPADLSGLTDVLTSTLAGLIAMTRQPTAGVPPAAGLLPSLHRRDRPPRQGARWTTDDDTRLTTRFRAGATPTDLAAEFGRTEGGIRARLEHLGVLPPSGRWPIPRPDPADTP